MSENYASYQIIVEASDANGNGGVDGTEEREDGTLVANGSAGADPDVSSNGGAGDHGEGSGSDNFGMPLGKGHDSAEEEPSNSFDAEPLRDNPQVIDDSVGDGKIGILEGDHVENGSSGVEVERTTVSVVEMPVSVDQVDDHIMGHQNGGLESSDGLVTYEEDASKEETFEDAADELIVVDGRRISDEREGFGGNPDDILQVVEDEGLQVGPLMDQLSLVHPQLKRTVEETELMARECIEYKREREMLARELAELHHELQMLSNQHSLETLSRDQLIDHFPFTVKEDGGGKTLVTDMPLRAVFDDCSKFTSHLKSAMDDHLQSEGTMRELYAILFAKDQEIEDLNAMVSQLSVSHDVFVTYVGSLQNSLKESSDARLLEEMRLQVLTNKLLASLSFLIQQDDISDYSVSEKTSLVEKSIAFVTANYMGFLSEINHLGQCLAEVSSDFIMHQDKEFDVIFGKAREKLLESRRREGDFCEKVNRLEEENSKLLVEVEKLKGSLNEANIASSKTKTDLEQAETKLAGAREKLSMAVTKGKALVQQRDSLKQSLNEKTNELEKCLFELHQKSSALESAEASALELLQSQQLVEQSLKEKTDELEKCLLELQQKSSALDVAKASALELVQSQQSVQESLLQRNMSLHEIEEAIFQLSNSHEEIQYMETLDKVRWLVNQENILDNVLLESRKLKDALSSIDLPETVSSTELDSQIEWLVKSFAQAKDDIIKLQEELASVRETVASHEFELSKAHNESSHLAASLLTEKQEKDSLQSRLEDLKREYVGVVEKLSLVSSEKNGLMKWLLDVSGSTVEDQEVDKSYLDTAIIRDKCMEKIGERLSASSESSLLQTERFQRLQSLLYVRDQELMLCKKMSEEDMVDRSEMLILSNELRRVMEEVVGLKKERDTLQKDLERSEEKSSLIREKLSMAVKKGKGLVQEREGLKISLDEKMAEIEKLKHELHYQESLVVEYKDQIQGLFSDLERIPKLESDASALKGERNQLEQFLLESNSMLQKVIGSIEGIVFPTNLDFEDPVEKVKWLAKHIEELQVGRSVLEQELEKSKEEVALLGGKLCQLTDAYATIQRLEHALSQADNKITVLSEENKDAEAGKSRALQELEKAKEEAVLLGSRLTVLEQELENSKEEAGLMDSKLGQLINVHGTIKHLEKALSQAEKHLTVLNNEKKNAEAAMGQVVQELEKAKEEAVFHADKLADAHATIRSLEDALSQAEKNVSILDAEKKNALVEKSQAEQELGKAKEESSFHFGKLTDAYATIQSLEDALSHAEKRNSMLGDEKKDVYVGKASVEKELDKVQGEAHSLASKLADALATIKSLEEALSHAENRISAVSNEKKEVETRTQEEIITLNTKLASCMEELATTQGRLENRSSELAGHFNNLLMFMKDEGILALLKQGFKQKFEGLRKMALIFKNIQVQFAERGSDWPQIHHVMENESFIENLLSVPQFEDYPDGMVVLHEASATDIVDSIPSYFAKIVEWFNMRNKVFSDNLEGFFSHMDKDIAVLLEVLQIMRDEVICMIELMSSLKLKVDNLEASNQAQENKTATLQNNVKFLVSACTDATQELQIVVNSGIVDPNTHPDLERLNCSIYSGAGEADGYAADDQCKRLDASDPVEAAESLLHAARRVRDQCEQFERMKNTWLATIGELKNELKENKLHIENAIRDGDFNLNKASNLENCCSEMKFKLEDYQASMREKEEEISSLHCTLSEKNQVAGQHLLTESQVESLFSAVNKIDIPFKEVESPGPQFSDSVNKLFYIVNNFAEMQHWMDSMIRDKEELQLSIEYLKKETENSLSGNHDLEKKNSDLTDLALGLEKIIQKLGRNVIIEDNKSAFELLPVLERMVLEFILECEAHRSKAQEFGTKLHENQMVVDELSAKVKFLQDSLHERPAVLDAVQERSTSSSFAGASEISEIEDVGPLGKNLLPPIPAAAHVRTMRKGSGDHLALNIDSESDRLINDNETDDKGHLFKFRSLKTSGFVPKQGMLIADRIDGIWVSGGRIFMSRPGARISLIAYWLLLHIWLLGTIL